MLLEAIEIAKSFGAESVLRSVNLRLPTSKRLAILGHSGSGKTTLLKILAGLESPDHGTVYLNGADVTPVRPERRRMVYLYQEPWLFPHLSARDNIAFGLRVRGRRRIEISESVDSMLERLGIGAHASKMPHQLSGGQKQRVAFGRALAVEPHVLLLDEPFSALDARTRNDMYRLFTDVVERLQIGTIFVTHDVKEALVLGDRFAYLQRGALHPFESRSAFLADPRVGAKDEWRFWQRAFQPNAE
ncbi:MAG: ABC transporter ATP-binding protein [Myxococcota bacterium]